MAYIIHSRKNVRAASGAVRVSKRAIRAGLEASFAEASGNETRYGGIARRAQKDAQESIAAFTEKRKPKFTGR